MLHHIPPQATQKKTKRGNFSIGDAISSPELSPNNAERQQHPSNSLAASASEVSSVSGTKKDNSSPKHGSPSIASNI